MFVSDPTSHVLTVVIADDHKIVRDGIRFQIEQAGGLRFVGEASNGRDLVECVQALKPEVVVTDLAMDQLNGIEATRLLREAGYRGIVLMLSMHDERHSLASAFAAGVNAYIHKDHAFEQVLTALAACRRGERWVSPELPHLELNGEVGLLSSLLTGREREVLQLFAEGKGTKEIASDLGISPKTVEVHRLKLFAKLRVNNVVELARIAIKEGLVSL